MLQAEHRGIVRAAHKVAPKWMSCEGFDLARLPYFNQDVEDEGTPEPVKELREKIRAYDAVLIATSEYDYAIPGVLTAALDWALRSRYDPTPFRHKPVGIVGASPIPRCTYWWLASWTLSRRSAWRLRTPLRESRPPWRPGQKSSP
jgi:NAD(P)H-dependent FMN reductase